MLGAYARPQLQQVLLGGLSEHEGSGDDEIVSCRDDGEVAATQEGPGGEVDFWDYAWWLVRILEGLSRRPIKDAREGSKTWYFSKLSNYPSV